VLWQRKDKDVTKRKFDRFSFKADALVTYKDRIFKGEVADLSLKGLFVHTSEMVELDEMVKVSIHFRGADEKFSFTIPAKVVRRSEEGIGLSFQRIDIDSALLESYGEMLGDGIPEEDVDVPDACACSR
jgi:hypothetical protein